jgi:hypothetical protein
MSNDEFTVAQHFADKAPNVWATYDQLLKEIKKFGKMSEEPKKTSIHLMHSTAFAGVATRKAHLVLTVKSDSDLKSTRIHKSEKVSAHRYHHEMKLSGPGDVDAELVGWLKRAYELSE